MFKQKSLMFLLVAGFLHCAGSSDDAQVQSVVGNALEFLRIPFGIQERLFRGNLNNLSIREQQDLEYGTALSLSDLEAEAERARSEGEERRQTAEAELDATKEAIAASIETAEREKIASKEEEELLAAQIQSLETAEREKTIREEEESRKREETRIVALEEEQLLAAQIQSIKTEEARIGRERSSGYASVSVQTDATPRGFDPLERKQINELREIAERCSRGTSTQHTPNISIATQIEEDLAKTTALQEETKRDKKSLARSTSSCLRSSKTKYPDAEERREMLQKTAWERGGSLKYSSEEEEDKRIRRQESFIPTGAIKGKRYLELDKQKGLTLPQKEETTMIDRQLFSPEEGSSSPPSCAAASSTDIAIPPTPKAEQPPTTEVQQAQVGVSAKSASSSPPITNSQIAEQHGENSEEEGGESDWLVC